jgi:hypothetical protein
MAVQSSGYLPGTLWYAYQATADPALRTKAQNWQAGLAGQATNTTAHDGARDPSRQVRGTAPEGPVSWEVRPGPERRQASSLLSWTP